MVVAPGIRDDHVAADFTPASMSAPDAATATRMFFRTAAANFLSVSFRSFDN
jgi:hypothetical protein